MTKEAEEAPVVDVPAMAKASADKAMVEPPKELAPGEGLIKPEDRNEPPPGATELDPNAPPGMPARVEPAKEEGGKDTSEESPPGKKGGEEESKADILDLDFDEDLFDGELKSVEEEGGEKKGKEEEIDYSVLESIDESKMNESEKTNLGNLRKIIEAQRSQLEERKAVKPEGEQVDPEAIKTLEDRNKELESIVARTSFVESTEYKEKYVKPYNMITGQMLKVAKDLEVENAEGFIKMLLNAPSAKERTKILATMDEGATMMSALLVRSDEVRVAAVEACQNATSEVESYRKQQEQEMAQAVAQMKQDIMKHVNVELPKKGFYFLQEVPGNDNWNKKVAGVRARISAVLGDEDVTRQSEYLAMGVMASPLLKLYQREREERMKLEKRLGIQRQVRPKPGAEGGRTEEKEDLSDLTPKEAVRRAATKAAKKLGR